METLDYVLKKYNVETIKELPCFINDDSQYGLPNLFAELGFTKGSEIGVESGKYSEAFCKAIPNLELISIDAWTAYAGYRERRNQEYQDMLYERAKQTLSKYNCRVIKGFSMDVVKTIPDGSLDFVFIDANHEYQSVVNDIAEWSKKVRKGGIVSGHDFRRFRIRGELVHVVDAITGWCTAYRINPWFAFITKAKGECWFYVK